jgi:hypothetical protein
MKLLTCVCERESSHTYRIPSGLRTCGKFLQVFRGGVLQLNGEFVIFDHAVAGHFVWFPEAIPEEENIMVTGVVH